MQKVLFVLQLTPYTKNDMKSAPELDLKQGELVIRDRGYLTTSEIQRHLQVKADCIYRHKSTTIYLETQTGKVISMALQATSSIAAFGELANCPSGPVGTKRHLTT